MKLLPFLLLSIGVSALAVVVYDHVRGEEVGEPAPLESADVRGLEERLAVLESARPPVLVGSGVDARVLDQLREINRRLKALEASSATDARAPSVPLEAEPTVASRALAGPKELRPEDVERFRKLRTAAWAEDRRRKASDRIEKALSTGDLPLTDGQKEQLLEAYTAFESRRDELWDEAKRQGVQAGPDVDWTEVIATTNAVIQREFAEQIATFLPWQDAEQVSGMLHANDK